MKSSNETLPETSITPTEQQKELAAWYLQTAGWEKDEFEKIGLGEHYQAKKEEDTTKE